MPTGLRQNKNITMKTETLSMKTNRISRTIRRSLLAAALPLLAATSHAQMNIGSTIAPNSSAVLQVNSGSNRGILFPRVALTGTANAAPLAGHTKGMTVYNTATAGDVVPGFYSNDGSKWVMVVAGATGTVSTLSTSGTPQGLNVGSTLAPDASAALEITSGGNKGLLLPSVALTGSANSAPLAGGSHVQGMVVYNTASVTDVCPGTYVNDGTKWIRLEGACGAGGGPSQPGIVPSTVTLAQNSRYWIASVHDNNYLPYTAPTGPATTAVVNAGATTQTLVDIQGTLTTTGTTVYIPATVTGSSVAMPAWSSSIITVPANLTEDGTPTQVQLSWAAQTLTTTSSPYLVATLKAVGGTLNAKKLDINAGIGNDHLGVLLGTLQYPYNAAGTMTTYELRDIPGIPDRMFGQIDNAGKYEHNFLYLPVQAEDGKIWLNNNLGAAYANLDHPAFNLTQQATSSSDLNAMGSLFQWGRKADGHELVNRYNYADPNSGISTPTSTFVYGIVYGQVATWSPTTPNMIFAASSDVPPEWASSTTPNLANRWQASSSNNPCPQGFKVPLQAEWQAEITAIGGGSNMFLTNKALKLTIGGEGLKGQVYNNTASYYSVGDGYSGPNYYATPTVINGNIQPYNVDGGQATRGKSVRCIQQ